MPRIFLIHLNIEAYDESRSPDEILQAILGAIEVGSDDDSVRELEIVHSEAIEVAPMGGDV